MAVRGLVIGAILILSTVHGDTRHGYGSCNRCGGNGAVTVYLSQLSYKLSCNRCGGGGNGAYNTGRNIGAAINGVISNKIQGVAGFIDGLVGGPAHGGGCGGCSSSCGSPGCGSGDYKMKWCRRKYSS